MKQVIPFACYFLFHLHLVALAPLDKAAEHQHSPENNVQQKFTTDNEPNPIATEDRNADANESNFIRKTRTYKQQSTVNTDDDYRKNDFNLRHHKMLDYFNYFPPMFAATYPIPAYYPAAIASAPLPSPQQSLPPNYYGSFNGLDDDGGNDDDLNNNNNNNNNNINNEDMSRANRRRPSANNQNSPIFYIRLPPTPYMFVPGMGYISQPPTIQPISTQYQMPQPVRHVPMNPFINVPVNFLSNGKPTNVYQWNTAPPMDNAFGPQYPGYLPSRPITAQRPQYRPPKPYLQDSKITHLKGPFVFNGRPEEIFVLPNNPYSQPPQYSTNYNVAPPPQAYGSPSAFGPMAFGPSAYSQPGYSTPYHAPYNSIFTAESIPNYY